MNDMPPTSYFAVNRNDAVVELRMNLPEKANSMTPDFWSELPALVRALDKDVSVRALVISGEGKHFSSGMDLNTLSDIGSLVSQEPGRAAFALRQMILSLQDAFNALEQTRLPVIAAIHGAAIGGAVDMITACDIRLASSDAYFSIEEINIGMTADVGTLQRLPKLIPMGLVMELALTGRRFSADEARGWGLINAIHNSADETRNSALELAKVLTTKSPLAIAGIKQTVHYARDHSVAEGLDQIASWNAGMLRAEDLMTAMQARMARKEAVFKDLLASA